MEGIGNPRKIRNGTYNGDPGTYWAWPVDGYWDIHHADPGFHPDGSEVISEFHGTFAECRTWVKELVELEKYL